MHSAQYICSDGARGLEWYQGKPGEKCASNNQFGRVRKPTSPGHGGFAWLSCVAQLPRDATLHGVDPWMMMEVRQAADAPAMLLLLV